MDSSEERTRERSGAGAAHPARSRATNTARALAVALVRDVSAKHRVNSRTAPSRVPRFAVMPRTAMIAIKRLELATFRRFVST